MVSGWSIFKRKPPSIYQKKVNLVQVPDSHQFEDLTLTKDFISFIDEKIKISADMLMGGAWETDTEARELVGYLRACEELKAKYRNLYKALYAR